MALAKHFTDDERAAIAARRRARESIQSIAKDMGVAYKRVKRTVDELGIDREVADVDAAIVAALVAKGYTKKRIIQETGWSVSRVDRARKKSNTVLRPSVSKANNVKRVSSIVLSDQEWRYVAGGFDACGVIFHRSNEGGSRYGMQWSGRAEYIDHLRELLQTGSVLHHPTRSSMLRIVAKIDVITACDGMRPYSVIPSVLDNVVRVVKGDTGAEP